MNYKITCHLMPWELDYALLSFTQLKKSKYYLNKEDNVYIDVTLNLSSYLINWEKTKLPKEFFIKKYKELNKLLVDYKTKLKIYEGDELYGGLNTQRESTESHIDYYMVLNSDMYVDEHLLFYLIESSKQISKDYFVITPQIPKLWDNTWDVISHPDYSSINYTEWNNIDVYDVRYKSKLSNNEVSLKSISPFKWAGWMDLYSKKFWEDFYVSHQDWNGYGPCDWYSMMLADYAKQQGLDFEQYLLENILTHEYPTGPEKISYTNYYKDFIVLNDIPNQREAFEFKMKEYLQKGILELKEKNII